MKDSGANHGLEVRAFLVLERVPGSKDLLVSVLLRSGEQVIGQTPMGTVAAGQNLSLSVTWDQAAQRFEARFQGKGSEPVLSFIPFVWPGPSQEVASHEFSIDPTSYRDEAEKTNPPG